MIKTIFFQLNKEFSKVNQAAFILAFFTIFSQILGLLRDRLLGHIVKVGSNLDVYFASFRIPDLLFIFISSLFAVVALLPFLTKEKKESEESVRQFFSQVVTLFLILIFIGIVVFYFFIIPRFVPLLFSNFKNEMITKIIDLSRLMLFSPFFLGLATLANSVTQLFKKFLIVSLLPVLYNLGLIIGVAIFYPLWGLEGLGWGVVLGSFLYFVIQIPSLIREKFFPFLNFSFDWKKIKDIWKISIPRNLGISFYNLSFLVLLSFASFIGEGSISIFNLSFNLYNTTISLIGISYATAIFPLLNELYLNKEKKAFIQQSIRTIRQVVFWSFIILVFFIILRAQIVRIILGTKNFSWENTRLVAASLGILSFSIIANNFNTLMTRIFYALGKTFIPLMINFFNFIFVLFFVNIFNRLFDIFPKVKLFLESLLRINGLLNSKVIILSFSLVFSIILSSLIFWFFLKKFFKDELLTFKEEVRYLKVTFFHSFIASSYIGATIFISLEILSSFLNLKTFLNVAIQIFVSSIMGLIIGYLVLKFLNNEELKYLENIVKNRIKIIKRKLILPPQEVMDNKYD